MKVTRLLECNYAVIAEDGEYIAGFMNSERALDFIEHHRKHNPGKIKWTCYKVSFKKTESIFDEAFEGEKVKDFSF